MRFYSIFKMKYAISPLTLLLQGLPKTAVLIITTAITITTFAQSHYQTLGLPETATQAEIKKTYRKLAMKYHPDRHQDNGTEEKFKAIKNAYEALSRNGEIDNTTANIEQVEVILEKLQSNEMLSHATVAGLISKLGAIYFEIASSSNPTLHQNFQKALIAIANIQAADPADIIQALTRLDTIQDFTYGMYPNLDANAPPLPLDRVAETTAEIIDHLQFTTMSQAKNFLENLAAFTTTPLLLPIGNYKQTYAPKLNSKLAAAVLKFGVRHNMITDASSLLSFANTYSNKILDDRQRETPLQMLLRARPEFVLSLMKSATIGPAQQIINNLYGMNQALAYEEWLRSGIKTGITAEDILTLIQKTRTYANHWLQNRFGSDYKLQAQKILDRIHTVNLTIAADFHNLNPSKEQIISFIQLSDFKSTEYTVSRLFPNQLAARDYKVQTEFQQSYRKLSDSASNTATTTTTTISQRPAVLKCPLLFK